MALVINFLNSSGAAEGESRISTVTDTLGTALNLGSASDDIQVRANVVERPVTTTPTPVKRVVRERAAAEQSPLNQAIDSFVGDVVAEHRDAIGDDILDSVVDDVLSEEDSDLLDVLASDR